MPDDDEALREAVAHRGLKLVKSRRRKAGVGDYGRFGLTDSAGKALFGFDDEGLTATPTEIRDYLRKSEVSTWAQSAETTPDRAGSSQAAPAPAPSPDARRAKARPAEKPARRKAKAPEPRQAVEKSAPPAAPPEPELKLRAAAKADLEAIGRLIGVTATALAARFEAVRRGGGVVVADRGGVIGCVAWATIPGLGAAPIGRITTLAVAEDRRREGIGRALVDAASIAMVEQDCATVEAMSEIALRNANGFYRALGLRQVSYRFVRQAGD